MGNGQSSLGRKLVAAVPAMLTYGAIGVGVGIASNLFTSSSSKEIRPSCQNLCMDEGLCARLLVIQKALEAMNRSTLRPDAKARRDRFNCLYPTLVR